MEKKKLKRLSIKNINIVIAVSTILIATILQISLTNNINVWQDEIYTMLVMRTKTVSDFLSFIINNVQPLLYYVMLYPVALISNCNISVLKIFSIFPTILLNIIIAVLTLKDKEKAESKLTSVLLPLYIVITTLTYNFLENSLQLRMYSWAMFFVTMSGIFAYKTFKEPNVKNIILFIILSLGSAYTQYYALIMEVIIYFYLFLALFIQNRANIKKIAIITIATIVGYLPWLGTVIKEFITVTNDFWITFKIKDILSYLNAILSVNVKVYFGLQLTFIALAFVLFVYSLYNFFKDKNTLKEEKQEKVFAMCAFSVPFFMIAVGIILNVAIRPMYTGRYVFPAVALFWLGIIIMLKYVKPRKILVTFTWILVVLMSIVSYKEIYKLEYDNQMEKFIEYINEEIKENDIITGSYSIYHSALIKYFFPNNVSVEISTLLEQMKQSEVNGNINNVNIWYIDVFSIEDTEDMKKIREAGYDLERVYMCLLDNWVPISVYKIIVP